MALWRSLPLSLLFGLVWGALSALPARAAGLCPAQLSHQIEAVINQPSFQRARWGILLQTLATNGSPQQTLYAHDAQQHFIPASNAKLLTTAAALESLGPQFRIRTSVYQTTAASQPVTLEVVGRGDPSLTTTELRQLARQIGDRQIRSVDRLIANDQFFRGAGINPTWEWEDIQAGYGAPVRSLILNQNQIGLTLIPQALGQPLRVEWQDAAGAQWQVDNQSTTAAVDAPEFLAVGREFDQDILHVHGQLRLGSAPEPVAVSIPDPAEYFVEQLRQALAEAQIPVEHIQVAAGLGQSRTEIAAIESAPLAELLIATNQDSNNLHAEVLLRWLGIKTNPNADSTLESGLAALNATLTKLGLDPESYALVDGSGLSRQNLVSPEAIVQVLQAMAQSPYAELYRTSLAVAGISGTLQHRFQGTPIQSRFLGKTGSMNQTAALSGYLNPPNYPPLVVSILVNQANLPSDQLQQAIDEVIERMAQLHPC